MLLLYLFVIVLCISLLFGLVLILWCLLVVASCLVCFFAVVLFSLVCW